MDFDVTLRFDSSLHQIIIEKFFEHPAKNIIIPAHLQVKRISVRLPQLLHWIQSSLHWIEISRPKIALLNEIEFHNLTEQFFESLIPKDIVLFPFTSTSFITFSFETCWTLFPRFRTILVDSTSFSLNDMIDYHSELFAHFSPKKKKTIGRSVLIPEWYHLKHGSPYLLDTIPVFLQQKLAFYIPKANFDEFPVMTVIKSGFTDNDIDFLWLPDQWIIHDEKIEEMHWNLPLLTLDETNSVSLSNLNIFPSDFEKNLKLKTARFQQIAFYFSEDNQKWNPLIKPDFNQIVLNLSGCIAVSIPNPPRAIAKSLTVNVKGKDFEFSEIMVYYLPTANTAPIRYSISNWQQNAIIVFKDQTMTIESYPEYVAVNPETNTLRELALLLQCDSKDIHLRADTVVVDTVFALIRVNDIDTLAYIAHSQMEAVAKKGFRWVDNVFGLQTIESVLKDYPLEIHSFAFQWIDSKNVTIFQPPFLDVQIPDFENGALSFQTKSTRIVWPWNKIQVQNSNQIIAMKNLDFNGSQLQWGNPFENAELKLDSYFKFNGRLYHSLRDIPINPDPTILTLLNLQSDGHSLVVNSQRRFFQVKNHNEPIRDENLVAINLSETERIRTEFVLDQFPSLQNKPVYYISSVDGIEKFIIGNDNVSALLNQCLGSAIAQQVSTLTAPESIAQEEEEIPPPPEEIGSEIPGLTEDIPLPPGEGEEEIPPPPEEIESAIPVQTCTKKSLTKENQRIFIGRNGHWIVWDEIQELIKEELANKDTKEMLEPLYNKLKEKHDQWLESIKNVSTMSNYDSLNEFFDLAWEFYGFYWLFYFKSWKSLYLNPPADVNRFDLFSMIVTTEMPSIIYENLFPSLKTAYETFITPNGPWCWKNSLRESMQQQYSAEVFDYYMEHGFGYKVFNDKFLCSSTLFQERFENIGIGWSEKQAVAFKNRWEKYIKENSSIWGNWISSTWFADVVAIMRSNTVNLQQIIQQKGIKDAVLANRVDFSFQMSQYRNNLKLDESKMLRSLWLGNSPISKFVTFQKMQVGLLDAKMESMPSPDQFTEGLWKFLIDKSTPEFYETYLPYLKVYRPGDIWKDSDFETLTDLLSGKKQPKPVISKEKDTDFNRLNLFFGLNYEVEPISKNPKPHKIASRFIVLQKKLAESSPLLDLQILQFVQVALEITLLNLESGKLSEFDSAIAKKILAYFSADALPLLKVKIQNNDITTIDPSKLLVDGEISYAFSCPVPKLTQSSLRPDFVWNEYNFIISEMKQSNMVPPSEQENMQLEQVFKTCASTSQLLNEHVEWNEILESIYGKEKLETIANHKDEIMKSLEKINGFKEKLYFLNQSVDSLKLTFKSLKRDQAEKTSAEIITQWQSLVKQQFSSLDADTQLKSFSNYALRVYLVALAHSYINYLWSKFDLDTLQTAIFQDIIKAYI